MYPVARIDVPVVKTRLAICVITRGRATSLRHLLDGLAQLQRPVGLAPAIVVVENETQAVLEDDIRKRSRSDLPFVYGWQPVLGIPFARNLALELALGTGVDYIAFLDDDEVPSDVWLAAMWDKLRGGEYDLVGGPVEPVAASVPVTWCARHLLAGLRVQEAHTRLKARLRTARGRETDQFVATNNWVVRSSFILENGLAFDERMGFSGSTDLKFWQELKRAGGQVGWCDAALVRESVSSDRLTLAYQYRRARDQAVSNFRVRHPHITPVLVLRGLVYSAGKLVRALASLMWLPVSRGASLLPAVRSAGQAVGRWHALRGRHSNHYQRPW